MDIIQIHLQDAQRIPRRKEPFQLGVPIPQGHLAPDTPVALTTGEGSEQVVCQSSPMTTWPDGSVRWLKLQFLADLEPGGRRVLELSIQDAPSPAGSPLKCTRSHDGVTIHTGAASFHLPSHRAAWGHTGGTQPLQHQLVLTTTAGEPCQTVADTDWQVTEQGPVSLSCSLEGWLVDGEVRLARFHCTLTFFRESETIRVRTAIHNPRRALHPGGLWDLGDPGSIHFRALTLEAELRGSRQARISPEPGSQTVEADNTDILLYQDSSGGENWNSINHVNASGEVTTRFRGYRLLLEDNVHLSGDRASPRITVTNADTTVQATLPRFWQNFPSALGVQKERLVVGLFPREAAESYELQGGERKTQTAYFHYGNEPDALAWTLCPLVPVLNAEHYDKARAFPWFNAGYQAGPLDELIQRGVEGPSNFFAKRDVIDEYGWRNFGDIFADHETLYQPDGAAPLISHYNNQYDAIYGFARQFALTGDTRWFELMEDLTAHVRDIDIYHTDEDRSEYNHGLFWHTDHYLPAHTATHRTFSRHNDTSSTPGQTGGGPAEEHCYTTGLLYHYFLTGEASSRDAVLDLAGWMKALHEGNHSLTETLLKIKRYDLPKLKRLLKGETVSKHRFAFNRGTGNYLNALIDAHLLAPSDLWLEDAEQLIRGTVHPADNIERRNLLDVETSWSYLVFLTSLARYLLVKMEQDAYDQCFRYAYDSFRHYTRWMMENEHPFLSNPELLEFPNLTWAAQDVRKGMLFFMAACFDPEYKDLYMERANFFLDYVTGCLAGSDETNYSRIQIILLQNFGPQTLDTTFQQLVRETTTPVSASQRPPDLTIGSLLARSGVRIVKAIRNFHPGKEKAWLQARLENR